MATNPRDVAGKGMSNISQLEQQINDILRAAIANSNSHPIIPGVTKISDVFHYSNGRMKVNVYGNNTGDDFLSRHQAELSKHPLGSLKVTYKSDEDVLTIEIDRLELMYNNQ